MPKESLSFEDFLKYYGIKMADYTPKTFAMDQIEWLIDSIRRFGYSINMPVIITMSEDPALANHCADGRHRLYAIYRMIISGIKIYNLQTRGFYKGYEMPRIPIDSEPVSNVGEIYALIARFEILHKSKPEQQRKQRIFFCLEGIQNQMKGPSVLEKNFTLHYFSGECAKFGLPATVYIEKYFEEKNLSSDDSQTNKNDNGNSTNNGSQSSGSAQSSSGHKMPSVNDEYYPMGVEPSKQTKITEGLETEIGWLSKRMECPTCDGSFTAMVQVKKDGKVLQNADVEIKAQSLRKAIGQ
jgi:hypothetical protein